MQEERTYTAFAATNRVASGDLKTVLLRVQARAGAGENATLLVFEDQTGQQVEFNYHGTPEEMLARELPQPPRPGPGRPKLGVVSREVSLLPRHWEWLEAQPGGISVTLRRMVDEARKREPGKERARQAQEAAGRFMTSLAGDLPGYEEASRALYAGNREAFDRETAPWPADVREYALLLANW